ncbi:MAG: methylenetetrahydrofolate reductase [Alphaproteobacteria bacterium]|nr:methylenetetrahydrofolate reductase [Alphaproteobacteria bacterium SS10]MBV6634237.1 methylenetetrahydrofolate reductase [Alphaproteobacteria bacterium SS10]
MTDSSQTTTAEPMTKQDALARLLNGVSVEMTAGQIAKRDNLGEMLAAGSEVYIPYLPGSEIKATTGAAPKLIAQDLRPVPHIPARTLKSERELDETLSELAGYGVDTVLLIAGDTNPAAGPFDSTMDVLETGLLAKHGMTRIAVAGHPEGHPHADSAELDRAIEVKSAYAKDKGAEMWIVTQFIFSTEPLIKWDRHLLDKGFDLPVHVGLPGPAKLPTLLKYAVQCGVTASAAMLAKRPSSMKLLGRWAADDILTELAEMQADPAQETLVRGIHIYPFGDLTHAVDWLQGLRQDSA